MSTNADPVVTGAPAPVAKPFFTAAQVQAALGPQFSHANISHAWPLLCAALERQCILSPACEIAAAATVAVECGGTFAPIRERGGPAYLVRLYWTDLAQAHELGNQSAQDAVNFRGRGFVMITGRANYEQVGRELKLDLVNRPDLALEPEASAEILALFFRHRGIHLAAESGNWERVRRRVNGGLNGWADFSKYVAALSTLHAKAAHVPDGGSPCT